MATESSKPAADNGELKDRVAINIDLTSTHPLMNTVVVRHMFGYLQLEDIKTCRQVCRQWKTLARSLMQSLSSVNLSCSVERLRNFQALVSTSEYLPSSNFEIKGTINQDIIHFCKVYAGDIASICFLLTRNMLSVLTKNGGYLLRNFRKLLASGTLSSLRELTVISYIPEPISPSRPALSNFLSAVTFPSMKKLSIVKLSDGNMLALMKALPNLQSIQICNSDWDFLLKSMEEIDSTSLSKIRRIASFTGTLNVVRLQKLLDLNLILTHLELCHETDEVEEDDVPLLVLLLQKLINQQSKTLKMFCLPQVCVNGHKDKEQIISLPCMKLLKELHVGGQIVCSIDSFKTSLPVLRKYNCKFNINGSCSIQPVDGAPCLSLTHLVDLPSSYHSGVHYAQLHEQFPNVNNLELCIRDTNIVRCLWTLWPGLKVLNLKFAFDSTHSAFTGLSEEDCSEIQANRTYDFVNLDDDNILPSIRNLRNLMSLTLNRVNGNTGEYGIFMLKRPIQSSDIVGYLGISKLEQLRALDVTGITFSAECVEDMIRSLPNLLPLETRLECQEDYPLFIP